MVFSSHIFLFYFLPITLGLYYLMHWRGVNIRWMNLFITVASYVFYGWFEPWFVILMWVSTALDYTCGRVMTAPGATIRRRNVALGVSLVGNLGLLMYFKYYMFFMGGINHLMNVMGMGPHYYHIMAVTLPIGISLGIFTLEPLGPHLASLGVAAGVYGVVLCSLLPVMRNVGPLGKFDQKRFCGPCGSAP